jgi:chemotaxis protein MotB
LLADQLGKLPNKLSVEGHTDSKPYLSSNGYSNWELSSDRANAARKLIQQSGVRLDQVADVRGFADQRLRKPEDPFSPSNRRVSIVVKYLAPGDSVQAPPHTAAKPGTKPPAPQIAPAKPALEKPSPMPAKAAAPAPAPAKAKP